eukprot:1980020-Prymnesium_polylepis.2
MEHGLGELTFTLGAQAVQRLQLVNGAQPVVASRFADIVYARLAVDVERIAHATPSSLLHAKWQHASLTRHFTRSRGSKKPPREFAQPRFCNAWHIMDLLKMAPVMFLQPCVFTELDDAPCALPRASVLDGFGVWWVAAPPLPAN